MNTYLVIKTLHILSSVLLVGTGFGSAFYLFFTHRHGSLPAIVTVSALVVRADWWFTTPTVLLQPLTGLVLAHLAGWPLTTPWLLLAIILYGIAGACWLPVVVIQIRLHRWAAQALREQGPDPATLHIPAPLPAPYWRLARVWELLGYPAFLAMLGVFFLMVVKPDLGF